MSLYPVILCGGAGTRLWPASHAGRPKQFTAFVGERSLFQNTVRRVADLPGADGLLVVAGVLHAAMIDRQLRALGVTATVLLEPDARDSAPAIAAACAWIAARDPEGIAVIVASDHHVPDSQAFRDAALIAAGAAAGARIVTMGVTPRVPSTAYGYIAPGGPLDGVRELSRFVEKPDAATAQSYVDAGYLWNSGNFVASAATLLGELEAFEPALAASAREAVAQASAQDHGLLLGPAFRSAPKVSIDYAVMERTTRAAVLPVDFAWSDLGAWDAVREVSDTDAAGNAVYGTPVLIDASHNLVRAGGGAQVAVIGVSHLAVVAEGPHVLVCDLTQAQAVKTAVERLKALPVHVEPPFADLDGASRWFDQWLTTRALPLWWTLGADHVHGGFHEVLAPNAEAPAWPRRARVQGRQAFAYARAARLGWAGPWRPAVSHGLEFLNAKYRRADGLYRTLVDATGAPLDDTAKTYDQAFVLLALAELHHGEPRASLEADATALLAAIRARRLPTGGYREDGDHPFQSNAHMHLFEAALAWIDAGGGAEWRQLAEEIAALALTRFIDADHGFVREFFDEAWRPAPGADGRRLEPGHQFEWAWLMQRWASMGGGRAAAEAAGRLFAAGLRGVDPTRGVAIDATQDDFSPLETTARLWPQTEYLKAAIAIGDEARTLAAAQALVRYLDTPIGGLWHDRMSAHGVLTAEPAPASSLYHLIVAVAELRSHTQRASRRASDGGSGERADSGDNSRPIEPLAVR